MEKKFFYAAPTVELQEIVVEQGFAGSLVGHGMDYSDGGDAEVLE